jgi:hypothetical protein
MDYEKFAKDNGITISSVRVPNNPYMIGGNMDHWKTTLRMEKRTYTFFFSMGKGWNGVEPPVTEVLESMRANMSYIRDGYTYEDFIHSIGVDDSAAERRGWKAMLKDYARMERLLGEKFGAFMEL